MNRLLPQAICLALLVASSGLSQKAFSQQATQAGFRLFKDQNEQSVVAEYYGASRLRYYLSRIKDPQPREFPPLARLHEYSRLQTVIFPYGTRLTRQDIADLSKLKSVIEIELGFPGLNDEYVTIEGGLKKLEQMKSLEVLRLCKKDMMDEDLAFVASLPRIRHLEFNADTNRADEEGPTATDRCADYLRHASTIRSICIYDGRQFTDTFIAKISDGLPNLEHLELSSPELTDESLRLLATRCKKLSWLDIGSNRFTDAGARHLANAKTLQELWLRSRSLTADSVRHVAELQRLRHLELTVPSLQDQDVQMLARLPQLEVLVLRQPILTDKQFAMFRDHPTLESAFINGSRLSKEETVKVIESLSQLTHLSVRSKELQSAVDQALAAKQAAPAKAMPPVDQ